MNVCAVLNVDGTKVSNQSQKSSSSSSWNPIIYNTGEVDDSKSLTEMIMNSTSSMLLQREIVTQLVSVILTVQLRHHYQKISIGNRHCKYDHGENAAIATKDNSSGSINN